MRNMVALALLVFSMATVANPVQEVLKAYEACLVDGAKTKAAAESIKDECRPLLEEGLSMLSADQATALRRQLLASEDTFIDKNR